MDTIYSVFNNNYFPPSLDFIIKARIISWLFSSYEVKVSTIKEVLLKLWDIVKEL